MPQLPLLWDLLVIFALSVAVVFVFQKLRQPVIVGFLATGVIFGPHGVGLIRRSDEVETLAEIGVILLLFTIGIEFSFARLSRMRREVAMGGPLQVFGTALLAFLASLPFQLPWTESLILGFLIALSSTAIVLRVFTERGELMTPQAKLTLGILIFQDLCVVPVMLLIPLLADWGHVSFLKLLQVLGMSGLMVGAILVAARFAIPPFLRLVVATRSREVFLIAVILVVLGTAFASFIAGALIVLTAFDEIQVTKVDRIQGIIRGIRGEIQSWGGAQAFTGTHTELLGKTKTHVVQALDEAKKYVSYLEIESAKQQVQSEQSLTDEQSRKRDRLRNAFAATKSMAGELELLQLRLASLGPQAQDSLIKATVAEAIPLTLQTKLEKARMNSFELMSHLKAKSKEHKNSANHYQEIIQNITTVNNRIATLNAASSPAILDEELKAISRDMVPLTKQAPYTLLMMREVEIGLTV